MPDGTSTNSLASFDSATQASQDQDLIEKESLATQSSAQNALIGEPQVQDSIIKNLPSMKAALSLPLQNSADELVEDRATHFQIPESLSDEKERIFHLEQALDQALCYLDELNVRVKHQAMLEEQITLTEEYAYVQYQAISRLQDDLVEHKDMIAQRNLTITSLESDRALAQTNLLSLQQDQLSLRQENAQWKNACQELQQECDRQHRKMLALEQENTAMQEQILQQARQANEQETAVQYWKDRYASLQQGLHDVQKFLEEKMSSPEQESDNGINIPNILACIQAIDKKDDGNADVDELSASSLPSFNIPDFLIRRYRHRKPGTASKTR